MRTAESWVGVICPAAHIGTAGELERQIMLIQSDAMLEAADIASNTQLQLWQIGSPESEATRWIERAIKERANQLTK